MKNKVEKNNLEYWIYFLLFVLAISIRLVNLGEAPLSDFEASKALHSLDNARTPTGFDESNPAYHSLTSLFFNIIGSNNFISRLSSVIAGSLLVLVPFGFRKYLGRDASIIAAFGLALDPGLVALSRLAGGPMMAIGFGFLAVSFFVNSNLIMSGILAGLAISSGHSIYLGAICTLITLSISRLLGLFQYNFAGQSEILGIEKKTLIRKLLLICSVTIILICTLFFSNPSGLGSLGNSASEFLSGWTSPSNVPISQPLLALLFYQPLAFLFAIVTLVRGILTNNKKFHWIGIWVLIIGVITVIYPGRLVYDVAWALVPIWVLASVEVARHLKITKPLLAAVGQAVLIIILSILFWQISLRPQLNNLSWVALIIIPLIIILSVILIGLGWNWRSAKKGVIWAFILMLNVYLFSAMIRASYIQQNSPKELWTPKPGTGQIQLIEKSLNNLSLLHSGREDSIPILSLVDSPSLVWALEDFPDVTFSEQLVPGMVVPIILSHQDGSDLSQTMSYRGQDFVLSEHQGWPGPLPPWQQLWRWVLFREAKIQTKNIVLWARSDLFPDEPVSKSDNSVVDPLSKADFPSGEERVE